MSSLRKLALFSYPFIILSFAIFLSFTPKSHAGKIRTLILSPTQPGKVILALGHSTAISFPVKPERLVLGSPTKVTVDFLGNDVTVTPQAREPGNLLVYTKGGRYVILFELGNSSNYDDVVNIQFGGVGRALRLLEDSYRATQIRIESISKIKGVKDSSLDATVLLTSAETKMEGPDLSDAFKDLRHFHCAGCTFATKNGSAQILCAKPISEVRCTSSDSSLIKITRRGP